MTKKFNITRNGNKVNIEFNGDVFIIPNRAGVMADYLDCFHKSMREFNNEVAELSGVEYNEETDKLVQVWIVSEDIRCDNICRHFPRVKDGDTTYYLKPGREEFPENIFKGKKEGDVVDITWVPYEYDYDEETGDDELKKMEDVTVTAHLKLNQNEYRYRNFGPFEDAFNYVTR